MYFAVEHVFIKCLHDKEYFFIEIYQSGVFLSILGHFVLPPSRKYRFLDAAFKVTVQIEAVYFCKTSVTSHCTVWRLIPDDCSLKYYHWCLYLYISRKIKCKIQVVN
jgi:hypothetical protein